MTRNILIDRTIFFRTTNGIASFSHHCSGSCAWFTVPGLAVRFKSRVLRFPKYSLPRFARNERRDKKYVALNNKTSWIR